MEQYRTSYGMDLFDPFLGLYEGRQEFRVRWRCNSPDIEPSYRRYAIVSERDLRDGVTKLARLQSGNIKGTLHEKHGLNGDRV